ncbi:hypothetical protein [Ilumatobacter sp.]|uniref:hypothetical protein n=1 Tax=Ilumatobacter sp. TaxID=1967498 RepID=UPI003C575FA8
MFFARSTFLGRGFRVGGGSMVVGLAVIALVVHPIVDDRFAPAGPVADAAASVRRTPATTPATSPTTTSPTTTIQALPSIATPSIATPAITTPGTTTPGTTESEPAAVATLVDPFAPVTSPGVGDYCAAGLSADELSEFFARPIGGFQGADYQRAFKLEDGRVLWTFQDAFIQGTLVHNVGMVQSGRCFTVLNDGGRSWLLGDLTSHMRQWHWILDGGPAADGTVQLFVVQMNETGGSYLTRTRPSTLRRVVLDSATLEVLDVIDEPPTGEDLYGWAVTGDGTYTYLYSHCYQQFGFDTDFGFGDCVVDVKLARVPVGSFDAAREYWDGSGWSPDHSAAVPVVDGTFVFSGNNPVQVRFDGEQFVLVEKRDDWWGSTIEFGVADQPQGPFVHVRSVDEPVKCDRSVCNTYFASWLPWLDETGAHIWSIGHNRWNGAETSTHLDVYRPTFHRIDLRSSSSGSVV